MAERICHMRDVHDVNVAII